MKIYSTRNVSKEGLNCYDNDCTSFIVACHEGNEAKVDRLLKSNSEVQKKINTLANCGMNGFMIACLKGYSEIVSLFLKKASSLQLNVNAKDKKKVSVRSPRPLFKVTQVNKKLLCGKNNSLKTFYFYYIDQTAFNNFQCRLS